MSQGNEDGAWRVRFVLLVAAIAAISFLRNPNTFLLPDLPFEDGRDIFAFYYNHPEWRGVGREYAGYVSLVPNLVG